MFRKFILPLLSIGGLVLAVLAVRASSKPIIPADAVAQPPTAPYKSYVAGAGIVEASTENIAIGTQLGGVVTAVNVKVGDKIAAGDALFRLDDRADKAELAVRVAAVKRAAQDLERLRSQPRPEDLPPMEAKLSEMQATVADRKREYARLSSIESGAISRDELERVALAVQVAEAQAAAAAAELNRVKAGAWKPDLEIAEAAVESASAEMQSQQVQLERLVVRSPVAGTVLQVRVRAGEYAQPGTQSPLMLVGQTDVLHVRVDIDENDAWRVRPGAAAHASLRGNADLQTDLTFVRIEPYVVPKRNLSGDSTERVDTRVLQLLFSFKAGDLPAYVGQQMDVFIDSPPATTKPTKTAADERR